MIIETFITEETWSRPCEYLNDLMEALLLIAIH